MIVCHVKLDSKSSVSPNILYASHLLQRIDLPLKIIQASESLRPTVLDLTAGTAVKHAKRQAGWRTNASAPSCRSAGQ